MLPRHGVSLSSARGQVLAYLIVAAIRSAAATGSSCSHTRITVVVLDVMSSARSALSARACPIRAETKGLGCPPPVAIQVSGPSSPASPAVYKTAALQATSAGNAVQVAEFRSCRSAGNHRRPDRPAVPAPVRTTSAPRAVRVHRIPGTAGHAPARDPTASATGRAMMLPICGLPIAGSGRWRSRAVDDAAGGEGQPADGDDPCARRIGVRVAAGRVRRQSPRRAEAVKEGLPLLGLDRGHGGSAGLFQPPGSCRGCRLSRKSVPIPVRVPRRRCGAGAGTGRGRGPGRRRGRRAAPCWLGRAGRSPSRGGRWPVGDRACCR